MLTVFLIRRKMGQTPYSCVESVCQATLLVDIFQGKCLAWVEDERSKSEWHLIAGFESRSNSQDQTFDEGKQRHKIEKVSEPNVVL